MLLKQESQDTKVHKRVRADTKVNAFLGVGMAFLVVSSRVTRSEAVNLQKKIDKLFEVRSVTDFSKFSLTL